MTKAQLGRVRKFVADNIGAFHAGVLAKVQKKTLNELLKRCNPYLYKAKSREVAHDFVERLLADSLALSERTQFGSFLEQLAIFVGAEMHDGRKSVAEGVDLEFVRDGTHFIVSIKSGPNWGNSSQHKKQSDQFRTAKKVARQAGPGNRVEAVLGCCYGQVEKDKGDYDVISGQAFWRFLSGDDSLYLRIIEPLGNQAKRRNQEFADAYDQMLNQLTQEFMERFCVGGKIQWEEVVKFNSGKERPKPPPKRARKKG